MRVNPSEAPIACSLNAAGQIARHAAWERLAERALRGRQMTVRGVRLVFASEPGVEDELRELARLEGECCAFAEWRVEDHGDLLALDVRAQADGVSALHTMFEEPLSAAPTPGR